MLNRYTPLRRKAKQSKLAKRKANDNSTYWKKRADRAWGELIHKQTQCLLHPLGECSGKLEAHHLITRAICSLRHEVENGVLLCKWHHKFSPQSSAHTAPFGFAVRLEELYPEKFKWVQEHRWQVGTHNYRESAERLEAMLR